MKRTTVFLDEELDRDVKALAKRQSRPAASLVREALAEYVHRHRPAGLGLSFVAAGRSGWSDVAERHEEILAEELEPHPTGEGA
jgi:predicted transcriptional regulator